MKYFKRNINRGSYMEIQFNNPDDKREVHWKSDSIYIYDEYAYEIGLEALFISIIPDFNPSSASFYEMSADQWKKMYCAATEHGGELSEAINEANCYIDRAFKEGKNIFLVGY